MKKHLSILLVFAMLMTMLNFVTLPVVAADGPYATDDGFVYTVEGGKATITQYLGVQSQLTIPATINDIPVVAITEKAFYKNTLLTDVVVESGIQEIGDFAFAECTALATVSFPDTLTHIGESTVSNTAFYNNKSNWENNLLYSGTCCLKWQYDKSASTTSIIFKDGTTIIADKATAAITTIVRVVFPSSLKYIGKEVCKGMYIDTVVIPSNVLTIGDSAFLNCTKLKTVMMSVGITHIGDTAFYSCTGLTNITIPNSVTSIGSDAFHNCTGLTSVNIYDIAAWCTIDFGSTDANPTCYAKSLSVNGELVTGLVIPDGVTSISSYAFYGCAGIKSVTIPSSVTSIGDSAFYGCGLTRVTIPSSVTSIGGGAFRGTAYEKNTSNWEEDALYIGDYLISVKNTYSGSFSIKPGTRVIVDDAFYGCTRLTGITIPEGVTNIGSHAFYGCGLTRVTIPSGVTSIGSGAFSSCAGLTSITFPNGVTSIEDYMFSRCTTLTNVTLPNSVMLIGSNVFQECTWLKSVIIPNSVTSIGSSVFRDCTHLQDVYYAGSEEDWNMISIDSKTSEELGPVTLHFNYVAPTEPTNTSTTQPTVTATETTTTTATQLLKVEHTVDVSLGQADKETAYPGDYVTLTADAPADGMEFDKWVGDGVIFENPTALETRFVMLDCDVEIEATYKVISYEITVNGGTADKETATPGTTVMVTATPPEGKVFSVWTVNGDDVTLADSTAKSTTFTMPASDVTVTATFVDDPAIVEAALTEAKNSALATINGFVGDEPSEGMADVLETIEKAIDDAATKEAVLTAEMNGVASILAQIKAEAAEQIAAAQAAQVQAENAQKEAEEAKKQAEKEAAEQVAAAKAAQAAAEQNEAEALAKAEVAEVAQKAAQAAQVQAEAAQKAAEEALVNVEQKLAEEAAIEAKAAALEELYNAIGNNPSDAVVSILSDIIASLKDLDTVEEVELTKEAGLLAIANQLEKEQTGTQPDVSVGDANGDNAINMKDVLLLRKYLADMTDDLDLEAADVNADGTVNMKDVLMLRKYLADMIDKLGA